MAIGPTTVLPDVVSGIGARYRAIGKTLADYWALTKPDVKLLIAITVLAGFCLARPTSFQEFALARLIHTLLGTSLVAGGAGALNQFIERRFDAQMRRTVRRPVASGRITPYGALWFGVSLSAAGGIYLDLAVNRIASLLAVFTLAGYLFLYTPLKRKTALCTLVGAIPGAIPPLIGWVAASDTLGAGAWILSAIVFLWQFPHFMAIAWIYREDYDRAGYLVLPRGNARAQVVAWQSLLPSILLIPLCVVPTPAGPRWIILYSERFAAQLRLLVLRSSPGGSAIERRRTPIADCFGVYLPCLFLLMLFDKK
jgi:protoheme IX farnesyltransferase